MSNIAILNGKQKLSKSTSGKRSEDPEYMTIRITGDVIQLRDYSPDDKYKCLILALQVLGVKVKIDVESPCG